MENTTTPNQSTKKGDALKQAKDLLQQALGFLTHATECPEFIGESAYKGCECSMPAIREAIQLFLVEGADAKQDEKEKALEHFTTYVKMLAQRGQHQDSAKTLLEEVAAILEAPDVDVNTGIAPATELPPYDFAPWKPPFRYCEDGTDIRDSGGHRCLDLRGWGFLTGKGGINTGHSHGLDGNEAAAIIDRLGEHVVKLLNLSSGIKEASPKSVETTGQAELSNYVTEARSVVLLGIARSPNLPDYVKPLAKAIVSPLFSALGQAIGGFELTVYRTERKQAVPDAQEAQKKEEGK